MAKSRAKYTHIPVQMSLSLCIGVVGGTDWVDDESGGLHLDFGY